MSEPLTTCAGPTHVVTNQPPPLEPFNLFTTDIALQDAVRREGGTAYVDHIAEYGRLCGEDLWPLGFQANENPPWLRTHDRFGNRIDAVEYHPAYHQLMAAAVGHGMTGLPWRVEDKTSAHVARAALLFMHHQIDTGSACPLSMGFGGIPLLRRQPELAAGWLDKSLAPSYDPRNLAPDQKTGLLTGVSITEKQGGSDVQAITTSASPVGQGKAYTVVGHKWFCSAPMCDGFFTLARTEDGLSCFHLPRWRPDGTKNAFEIQRLKDKLGNRSNASAEVEFRGAHAILVGEPGRGIRTILEMLALNRLDCLVGSAGLMRQAAAQAIHHCTHRSAFGKKLVDQPLMRNVLADLALESEAATMLAFRAVRAYACGETDRRERILFRLLVCLGKFWVCKRVVLHVNEAQECLGGAGYIEESIVPRLFRDSPLNSIWEGSGNVQCLDFIRALQREEQASDVLMTQLETAKGANPEVDKYLRYARDLLADPTSPEDRGRQLAEVIVNALQAALLLCGGSAEVASAFIQSRLSERRSSVYGTLPLTVDIGMLIARASPHPR